MSSRALLLAVLCAIAAPGVVSTLDLPLITARGIGGRISS